MISSPLLGLLVSLLAATQLQATAINSELVSIGFNIDLSASSELAKQVAGGAGFSFGYSWGEELSSTESHTCASPADFKEPPGLTPGQLYPKPCFQPQWTPKVDRVYFHLWTKILCHWDAEWEYKGIHYADYPILDHVGTATKGPKIARGVWDCSVNCINRPEIKANTCRAVGSTSPPPEPKPNDWTPAKQGSPAAGGGSGVTPAGNAQVASGAGEEQYQANEADLVPFTPGGKPWDVGST
ncbi:uncharacterized protein LOC62_02G002700 [Vanrija pseudolonga]|uniref:Uncharacterized protein n=1 Tax=Vanrija pseudolonga TaxID=143232 RepID=A0AAF1BG45_9TREE|nr:hypothetical protein LOC62_02G002700 [Vanrija pseudolonga]